MKVLVVSDTHGVVKPFINELEKHKDAELIIHLGDHVSDAKEIQRHTDIPMRMVRGNTDYYSDNTPWIELLNLEGHKVLITHGHNEKVSYGPATIFYKAKECDANLAFHGHTHVFFDEVIEGIRIVNPGSAGFDRGGEYESYVVMNIDKDNIEIERIRLD